MTKGSLPENLVTFGHFCSLLDTSIANGQILDKLSERCQYDSVVSNEEYANLLAKTIQAMQSRYAGLQEQREKLSAQMKELDDQMAVVQEDIVAATAIWGRSPFGNRSIGETRPLTDLGMTEAVLYVLRTLRLQMSPVEVRDKMADWGFDFSKYESDEVSSIHTIIKRYVAKDLIRKFDDGPRRKSYKWIGKQDEHHGELVPETKTPKRG